MSAILYLYACDSFITHCGIQRTHTPAHKHMHTNESADCWGWCFWPVGKSNSGPRFLHCTAAVEIAPRCFFPQSNKQRRLSSNWGGTKSNTRTQKTGGTRSRRKEKHAFSCARKAGSSQRDEDKHTLKARDCFACVRLGDVDEQCAARHVWASVVGACGM